MKNEAMARAITELDDALLEDAMKAAPRQIGPWRRWCAAAACLIVVAAAGLAAPAVGRPAVSLHGTALTAEPAPVDETAMLRLIDPDEAGPAETELALTLRKETVLTASAGTLTIRQEGQEPIAAAEWQGHGRITVLWRIEDARPSRQYTLTAGSVTLVLEYSEALQGWTIRKDK